MKAPGGVCGQVDQLTVVPHLENLKWQTLDYQTAGTWFFDNRPMNIASSYCIGDYTTTSNDAGDRRVLSCSMERRLF
jgi:hypothetical protein